MSNYIGYIRVSTVKQVKGHSLDFQKTEILNYAKQHNITVERIYKDEGVSAVKYRPEFNKVMERATRETAISGVIAYSITRFGRSTQDLLQQITTLKANGKVFVSVKEQLDISTPSGKLMFTMLSAIAEFERDTTMERMQAGREYAKLHGTKSGLPMHRPKIDIDWTQVDYYREHAISWRRIASMLNISVPTLLRRAREKGYKINK